MSQNPFAHPEPSGLDSGHDQLPMTPERTSILAIASLVLSVLAVPACCIAVGIVPGLIGAFLGIAAMVMISKSNGRLGGRGLAISGVVIGLIFSVFSTAWFVGINMGGRMLGQYGEVVVLSESGDVKGVRDMLSLSANGDLTDEQVAEWAVAIDLAWGGVVEYPDGVVDLLIGWVGVGPSFSALNTVQMTEYPPPNRVGPIPVTFDHGTALLLIVMDQNETMTSGLPKLMNAGIVAPDGSMIWLIDPSSGP